MPSVGPEAYPGVQAVSPQVTVSHPPGVRLPLHSARPAVTFPAAEHHRHLVGTKLYCLVTEAHRCAQLSQDCYAALGMRGIKKCPTIIYRLKKYRDTGVPRCLVTSSIVDDFCKNPTVRIIWVLSPVLCHIIMLVILYVNFLPLDVVVMLMAFMLEF